MIDAIWKTMALMSVSLLMVALPASACRWAGDFDYVFYEAEPDTVDHDHNFFGAWDLPEKVTTESFIGQIVLHLETTRTTPHGASQELFIAEIVESSTHPERVGSRLSVFPFLETSCGPWVADGDSGFVVGDILDPDSSSPELFLHTHKSDKY